MNPKNDPVPNTENIKLVVSREFDAPRELVWQAWTQPEQMKAWLKTVEDMAIESVRMDLRIGGKYRLQTKMADGEYFTAAGTYLEVKPPERLVYTWDWEKDGAGEEFGELEGKQTQVTIELRAMGNRTQLVLTHEKFASTESRDRHQAGWQMWIGKLYEYIEAKQERKI